MTSYKELREGIYQVFGGLEDLKLLSLLVYGEVRGETLYGKAAVAWVALNRAKKSGWFGETLKDVVLKPYQFSCFLPEDTNSSKLEKISREFDSFLKEDKVFRECYYIARGVLEGWIRDVTHGALYYHSRNISLRWSSAYTKKTEIGNHIFYS